MNQPPHLTDAEIADITAPLTQGAARIKHLRSLGLKVDVKPNGQPLVWRAELEAVRRREDDAANDGRTSKQNWSDFDKRVRYGRSGAKTQGR